MHVLVNTINSGWKWESVSPVKFWTELLTLSVQSNIMQSLSAYSGSSALGTCASVRKFVPLRYLYHWVKSKERNVQNVVFRQMLHILGKQMWLKGKKNTTNPNVSKFMSKYILLRLALICENLTCTDWSIDPLALSRTCDSLITVVNDIVTHIVGACVSTPWEARNPSWFRTNSWTNWNKTQADIDSHIVKTQLVPEKYWDIDQHTEETQLSSTALFSIFLVCINTEQHVYLLDRSIQRNFHFIGNPFEIRVPLLSEFSLPSPNTGRKTCQTLVEETGIQTHILRTIICLSHFWQAVVHGSRRRTYNGLDSHGQSNSPGFRHEKEVQSLPFAHLGEFASFRNCTVSCFSSCFSQQRELQFQWVFSPRGSLSSSFSGWRGRLTNTFGSRIVSLLLWSEICFIECRGSKAPFSIEEILLLWRCKYSRFPSPENDPFVISEMSFKEDGCCVSSLSPAFLSGWIPIMLLSWRCSVIRLFSPRKDPGSMTVKLLSLSESSRRLFSSLNDPGCIRTILLSHKLSFVRFSSPANESGTTNVTLLLSKYSLSRLYSPMNDPGLMTAISFLCRYSSTRLLSPAKDPGFNIEMLLSLSFTVLTFVRFVNEPASMAETLLIWKHSSDRLSSPVSNPILILAILLL